MKHLTRAAQLVVGRDCQAFTFATSRRADLNHNHVRRPLNFALLLNHIIRILLSSCGGSSTLCCSQFYDLSAGIMPMLEHIDVRVLVNDHPLQEYADPEGDPDDSHSRVRYIESVVGQKFRVVVRLLPNFQLKNAPWFRSGFYIDNSTTEHYAFIGQEYLRHRKGCLQTSCDLSNKAHFAVWNDALGRLEDCAFEFGALGSCEMLLGKCLASC